METLPQLASYMFELPPELIAQHPPQERGQSRLMILDRTRPGLCSEIPFANLAQKLPEKTLLVLNEVKVSQARLGGYRPDTGGQVEAFILEPPPTTAAAGIYELWCLVRPGRSFKIGQRFIFNHPHSNLTLKGQVVELSPDGRRRLRFDFQDEPEKILDQIGHVPLPFYIKRPDTTSDRERYQTVYSQTPGAVAAPTAGLHFTRPMLDHLQKIGHTLATITLKVSAGTFAPLTSEQLNSGRLHLEEVTVPPATVLAITQAKACGHPVIAVGTTTVRALEWAARSGPLTAGQEYLLSAYQQAIADGFRFYSYGDAMLVI